MNPRVMNMIYSLGGAVVIVGALFKILHWNLGSISGSALLAAGLITEALIFCISAFEPPKAELDWTLVYPELRMSQKNRSQDLIEDEGELEPEEGFLSSSKQRKLDSCVEATIVKRLDEVLQEAHIDAKLLANLSSNIKKLETLSEVILPSVEVVETSRSYVEELSKVTGTIRDLKDIYQEQLQQITKQNGINTEVSETMEKIEREVGAFEQNLSQLNSVYGGMLGAMKKR